MKGVNLTLHTRRPILWLCTVCVWALLPVDSAATGDPEKTYYIINDSNVSRSADKTLVRSFSYYLAWQLAHANQKLEFIDEVELQSKRISENIASHEDVLKALGISIEIKIENFSQKLNSISGTLINYKTSRKVPFEYPMMQIFSPQLTANPLVYKILSFVRFSEKTFSEMNLNLCFALSSNTGANSNFSQKLQQCVNNYKTESGATPFSMKLAKDCSQASSTDFEGLQLSGFAQVELGKINATTVLINNDRKNAYTISLTNYLQAAGTQLDTVSFISGLCSSISYDLSILKKVEEIDLKLPQRIAEAQAGPVDKTLNLATELSGRYKNKPAAIFLLHTAALKNNTSDDLQYALGKIELEQGNINLAENYFRTALRLNPKNTNAALALTDILVKDGKYEGALQFAEKQYERLPDNAALCLKIGEVYSLLAKNVPENESKATRYLELALKLGGDAQVVFDRLGDLQKELGKTDKAIAYYKKSIRVKRDSATSSNLAQLYYEIGNRGKDLSKAIAYYDSAILYDPFGAKYYSSKGYCLFYLHNIKDAIVNYEKSVALDSSDSYAYFDLAYLHQENSNDSLALSCYNKSLAINPNYVAALNNRGSLFLNGKKYERALIDFKKALELDPYYNLAYHNMGLIHEFQDKYTEAIGYFSKAIDLDSTYINSYYNRGKCYYMSGDYGKAKTDLVKYIRDCPSDDLSFDAYYYLGENAYFDQEYEESVRYLDLYIAKRNDFSWSYYYRGQSYSRLGLPDKALDDFQRAHKLELNDISLYIDMSNIYQSKNLTDEAIRYTQEGIKKAEANGLTKNVDISYGNLGWYYFIKGNFDQAIQESLHALKLNSKLAYVNFNLGLIYLHKSEWTIADQYYQNTVKMLEKGEHQDSGNLSAFEAIKQLAIADLETFRAKATGELRQRMDRLISLLNEQALRLKKKQDSKKN